MARKIVNTPTDPTLEKTPVEIGGRTYFLCFDLGALAEAERELNIEGHDINLLRALPVLNLANVREVFPAAVRKFHPELSFAESVKLVTLQSLYPIAKAIVRAWDVDVVIPAGPDSEKPPTLPGPKPAGAPTAMA